MTLKQLIQLLKVDEEAFIYIKLPYGESVPSHFHITEVARLKRDFIDCGGTIRESTSCMLQIWTAGDTDHRLLSGKLAKILTMAEEGLGILDSPLEMEYGYPLVVQFKVSGVDIGPKTITISLIAKQTECLAPDKCGVVDHQQETWWGHSTHRGQVPNITDVFNNMSDVTKVSRGCCGGNFCCDT